MHEPAGYPRGQRPRHRDGGRLGGPARRVLPRRSARGDPVAEVRRCIAAGARGIKLHPRAENGSTIDEPVLREIVAEPTRRGCRSSIHAGRGIPALGRARARVRRRAIRTRASSSRTRGVSISRGSGSGSPSTRTSSSTRRGSARPDLLMLFSHVPPGQLLYATDIPFGTPQQTVSVVFRCALQAGLRPEALASVAGGQIERIVAREEDARTSVRRVGDGRIRRDPLLARVEYFVTGAFATALAGGDDAEFIDLARLACLVGDNAPQAAGCAEAIRELLALALTIPMGESLTDRFAHIHLLVVRRGDRRNPGRSGRFLRRRALASGAPVTVSDSCRPPSSRSQARSPATTRSAPRPARSPTCAATGRRSSTRPSARRPSPSSWPRCRPTSCPTSCTSWRVRPRCRFTSSACTRRRRGAACARSSSSRCCWRSCAASTPSSSTPTRSTTPRGTRRSARRSCSRTWTPASAAGARSPSSSRTSRRCRRPASASTSRTPRRSTDRSARAERLLDCFGARLRHVHVSSLDEDCHHVPLTAGDEARYATLLRRCRDVPWILEAPLREL